MELARRLRTGADRQLTHPVTFANLDKVIQLFGKNELVLTMSSPTGAYVVHNVNVPGITPIFPSKQMVTSGQLGAA